MKLFVWGTGRLAGKVIGRWIKEEEIFGYIDSNPKNREFNGRPVFRPNEIPGMEYDAIVVITLHSREIKDKAESLGIQISKMIFLYNNFFLEDMNRDYGFVESVLGKEYSETVKNRYHVVRGTEAYGDLCFSSFRKDAIKPELIDEKTQPEIGGYLNTDYVRIKCFELVVKEIRKRKLEGAVAEAGVFKGEFAQFLNIAFPNNRLYLFDTFEGFEPGEANREVSSGNASETFVEAYKNTNIDEVMKRMKNPGMVRICKGFFPESTKGIDENFIFVSLDMDFEDSIYEGLKYFWPKVVNGGYIFIHDYNSSLRGVESAVDRYEEDYKICLNRVPLCDANGTLVAIKSKS